MILPSPLIAIIQVDVQISALIESWVDITATVRKPQRVENTAGGEGASGTSLVAVTAASVAALTVYDMCKASSKDIIIHNLEVHGSL